MAARYTEDSIERLREAIDIVELIGDTTDLRRRGASWMGLCPFHDERSPSFTVDPTKGFYHCFGCRVGGDAITFVRETRSLDFTEAIEMLAERFNVELKRENEDPAEAERRQRRERMLALLDRSATFYSTYLWKAEEARPAREYLSERGLSEEVLNDFRVGFAPSAWDRLTKGAGRDGFSDAELQGTDLARKSQRGGLYDTFRERITFPLSDARGRVLGFGARAMREDQGAKYLNTKEGDLYHKGRLVFGMDRARQAIAKARRVVVVEGYTDVLALHQAGVRETIAIMGTALTAEQLGEMARAVGDSGTIFLALDADRAGQEAMLRAAKMAGERKIDLRVAKLPPGSDPADLVASQGEKAVDQILSAAVSVLEFEVGRVLEDAELDTPQGRDRALEGARALIAAAPQRSAVRDHLVRQVADRLDVPADYVVAQAGVRPRLGGSEPPMTPAARGAMDAEQTFLALCLRAGSLGREHLGAFDPDFLSSGLTRRARDYLLANFADPLAELAREEPGLAAMVAQAVSHADDEPDVGETVLALSELALEKRYVDREVRRAGEAGDRVRQRDLAGRQQRIRSAMDSAMGQVT